MIQEEHHLAAGHMAELRPLLDGVARRTALLRVGTNTTPVFATWALPQVAGVGVPCMCAQRSCPCTTFWVSEVLQTYSRDHRKRLPP